jgi:hypothetical protein
MTFAVLAYNILRWMGQRALLGPDAPIRHRAKRRRLKTVMQELIYVACRVICDRQPSKVSQELIYVACRLISSGRRLSLRFGRHCPGFKAFCHAYGLA